MTKKKDIVYNVKVNTRGIEDLEKVTKRAQKELNILFNNQEAYDLARKKASEHATKERDAFGWGLLNIGVSLGGGGTLGLVGAGLGAKGLDDDFEDLEKKEMSLISRKHRAVTELSLAEFRIISDREESVNRTLKLGMEDVRRLKDTQKEEIKLGKIIEAREVYAYGIAKKREEFSRTFGKEFKEEIESIDLNLTIERELSSAIEDVQRQIFSKNSTIRFDLFGENRGMFNLKNQRQEIETLLEALIVRREIYSKKVLLADQAVEKLRQADEQAEIARFYSFEERQKRKQNLFQDELKKRREANKQMGDIQAQTIEPLKAETSATLELVGAKEILAESNKKLLDQAKERKAQEEAEQKRRQAYFKDLAKGIDNLGDKMKNPVLSTALDGLGKMVDKFSDKFKKSNDANTENAKENAEAQKNTFADLAGEIESYSAILVSMTSTLFQKQNEMLEEEIEAAKEKHEALSAKYDEAVEKRQESDNELQLLEEQAKNARGGRLLVIQSQIDAEMAKNKQLADQEQKLQQDKDKAQKEIEKKQKQQKKNELKQQMVTSIANVAVGAVKAMAQWGFPLGVINAALIAAAGAIQVATISKQMSKLEDGGLLRGRRHRDGGLRIEGTNVEVEGGEYVVNRDSTAKNLGLIRYINSQRRQLDADDMHHFFSTPTVAPRPAFMSMFEEGGQLPMMDSRGNLDNEMLVHAIQNMRIEPRVSVTDINTVQHQMVQVDEWVGM